MKKYNYLILIFVIIAFSFLFFKKDYGFDKPTTLSNEPLYVVNNNIPKPKNVTINGIDYLQTQLPIGKFGGSFTSSLLGDPKTFNPYNANDATSAELSEIMYDGLVQTHPTDGSVIPKLAKNIEVLKALIQKTLLILVFLY